MIFYSSKDFDIKEPFYIYGNGGTAKDFFNGLKEKEKKKLIKYLVSKISDDNDMENVQQYDSEKINPNLPIVICSYAYSDIRQSLIEAGHKKIYLYIDKPNRPVFGVFTISLRCNASCPFCFLPPENKKNNREWTLSDFHSALKSNPYLTDLIYSGGEPLLHNHIEKFLEISKKKNLKNHILSNGKNHKKIRSYENVDRIVFSIFSHKNEIHTKYIPVDLSLLIKSIENALDQPNKIVVDFNVSVNKENIKDVDGIVKLAGTHGVSNINFNTITLMPHMPNFIYDMSLRAGGTGEFEGYHKKINEAVLLANSLNITTNLTESLLSGIKKKTPLFSQQNNIQYLKNTTRFCLQPWEYYGILNNGDVRTCCGGGDDKQIIGNIFEKKGCSFNNDASREIRSGLLNGNMVKMCQTCSHAKIMDIEQANYLYGLNGVQSDIVEA